VKVKVKGTDFGLGLGALAASAAYLYVASGIQESMLSDATGARGFPHALGWAMAALGLLLCLRSVRFAPAASKEPPAASESDTAAPAERKTHPHLQALAVLAILAGYIALAPYLGYVVATSVMLGAVAAYGGAAIDRTLLLASAGGSIGLWIVFTKMLGVSLVGSSLFAGL
jgi:hypothetical protein